jgi:iron(III) transport system permease protein
LSEAPINIYSLTGMTLLEGLRMVPTGFLMLVPLFRSMDPALEEAAYVSGTSPLKTIGKVTLPLILPGVIAIVIYKAMTALSGFEIPGIIGLPADIYVFSTKIYAIVQTAVGIPHYGQASALAMVYLLMAVLGIYIYGKAITKQERFAVITGKGYRPRLLDLGPLKKWALGLVIFYLFVTVFLPVLVFGWTSLLPYPAVPSSEALGMISPKHWKMVFSYSDIWLTFKNTLLMTIFDSTGTVLLAFTVSWSVIRTGFVGRRLLDQLSFIPHGIPGIIFGLAMIWVWLKLDFIPIYGTIWIIALGFIIHFMPYGTRAINAGLLQIHKELEEAAYVSGASPNRTLRKIVFPLLMPVFSGVWIWVFLHAVRIVGLPIMLFSGTENQVLAVLLWRMWDDGYLGAVSAMGLMIIIFLLLTSIVVRQFGFRHHGGHPA